MGSRSTETARWLAITALFAVLAVVHTWPLPSVASTHMLPGADPKTMMWGQIDLARNLLGDPRELMNGSAFYPFDNTIAATDHQLGNAIVGAPLLAAGAGALTTFNIVLLATFVLSGVFTCLLLHRLTGSWAAGLVAGCAFAFSTTRVDSLSHSHLLATQWLPLALVALHAYLDRPSVRRLAGFTGAALLVALSSWHVAVIGGIGIGLVALWTLAAEPSVRWDRLAGLGLAAALCALVLLPLAGVYAGVVDLWSRGGPEAGETARGPARGQAGAARFSVDLAEVLTWPEESTAPYAGLVRGPAPAVLPGLVTTLLALLATAGLRRLPAASTPAQQWWRRVTWSWIGLLVVLVSLALAGVGASLAGLVRPFAPFVVLGGLLVAAGLAAARRAREVDARLALVVTYSALALAGVLLALGPRVTAAGVDLGSGLWRLDLLPLPLVMRAPARFVMLTALGASVLAGLATAWLQGRTTQRAGLAVAATILLLLNVDLAFDLPPLSEAPVASAVDRWLAESEEPGAVIELPLFGNWWSIYASQELYGRRNVDGRGFLRPRTIMRLRAQEDLSDRQVRMLWEHFHPRYIVVRGQFLDAEELARIDAAVESLGATLELRASDGDERLYELYDRGRGEQLFRRWPRAALERSGGELDINGRLSAGGPGSVGEVTVLLNDRVLLQVDGPAIERRTTHTVRFGREHLVEGINTFEIRAGERRAGIVNPAPAEPPDGEPPARRFLLSWLRLR